MSQPPALTLPFTATGFRRASAPFCCRHIDADIISAEFVLLSVTLIFANMLLLRY